jgi:hypothetical protein
MTPPTSSATTTDDPPGWSATPSISLLCGSGTAPSTVALVIRPSAGLMAMRSQ